MKRARSRCLGLIVVRGIRVCSSVALEGSSEETCTAGKRARSDAIKRIVLVASATLTVKHQALFRKCHKPGLEAGLGKKLATGVCVLVQTYGAALSGEVRSAPLVAVTLSV